MSTSVQAETLKETITAAYLFNPTLKSARAQLRATDNQVLFPSRGIDRQSQRNFNMAMKTSAPKYRAPERQPALFLFAQVPSARSTARVPGILTGLPLSTLGTNSIVGNGTSNPRQAQVAIQQNVFDGFRTYNNVKGAEAGVEAGREIFATLK